MDLEQEVAPLADELPLDLFGHVSEDHRARIEVALEVEELAREVTVELGLQVGQGRLCDFTVGSLECLEESRRPGPEILEILGQLVARLRGEDVQAALELAEGPGEPLDVHRTRAPHPHGSDDGGEGLD